MDLYKLKTFRTVGVFLNFNKAAIALNCAQSTISAQIKSLVQPSILILAIALKAVLKMNYELNQLIWHLYILNLLIH
jgi:hypothetical protein